MAGARSSVAARAALLAERLEVHAAAIAACRDCGLHGDRTTPIVGEGPAGARLLLVSDAPRRHEDLQGRVVAGGARNVLDHALETAGLDPRAVRLTSIVRCRPPGDRPPTADELRACAGHLRRELDLVAPSVIVSLGAAATSVLLGRPVPLDRIAGYRLEVFGGITLVPTYHPSDVVRGEPRAAASLAHDLSVAAAVLDGRLPGGVPVRAAANPPAAANA